MQRRVLVVEDHPLSLELITDLLEQKGCQVFTAATAEAGLRLAAAERPDLILMELQLPGVTGYDLTRQLKANAATAGIPVVVVTGLSDVGRESQSAGGRVRRLSDETPGPQYVPRDPAPAPPAGAWAMMRRQEAAWKRA